MFKILIKGSTNYRVLGIEESREDATRLSGVQLSS